MESAIDQAAGRKERKMEGKKKGKRRENGRLKESAGFPLDVKAAYRVARVAQRVDTSIVRVFPCVSIMGVGMYADM